MLADDIHHEIVTRPNTNGPLKVGVGIDATPIPTDYLQVMIAEPSSSKASTPASVLIA